MYGVGLLGYRDFSFYSFELDKFMALVDSQMQWQLEKEDRQFEQFSIFTSHLMLATGNFKKGTDLDSLRKQVYLPLEDREKQFLKDSKKAVITKKDIENKKAELQRKFNI